MSRISIGFGAAIVFLAIVVSGAFWTTARLKDSAHAAAHAHQEIEAVTELHAQLQDSENALCSFLISGNARFLNDLRVATADTEVSLAHLRVLVEDDPKDLNQLDVAESLLRQRKQVHDSLISQRQAGSIKDSALLKAIQQTLELTGAIHRLLDKEIAGDERVHLAESVEQAQNSAATAMLVNGVSGVVGIIVVLAAAVSAFHDGRAKREAEQQVLSANRCLEGEVIERSRAEAALRSSEASYRLLFESNPHPMWVYDIETLRFLAVNDAAIEHYGYSRDEFVAKTIEMIRPREEVPALRAHLAVDSQASKYPGTWRHCKADDTIIDVEISSHGLVFEGRSARLVLAHDVTERNQVEGMRKRLAAILEATTDLVAITHPDGPVSYLNRAGRKILGVGDREQVSLIDFRPDWARRLIREEALPTAIREGVWSGETAFLNREGIEIPVSQVVIAHRSADAAVESFSIIARDVSERKNLEEQLRQAQKMEAIGTLAGGIAHDFNNLLTIINGYSSILLESSPPGHASHESLQLIRKSGDRAETLTRQLLAFSRKQILAPQIIDLNAVVRDLEKMLRRVIGEDIELTVELDPVLNPIKADPGQIEQVIMNLVVNARDAMPRGGRLYIRTLHVQGRQKLVSGSLTNNTGNGVLLTVGDTGCGMDASTRARIFEPFFTTKGLGKGTGLGLATAYGIVQQSEGRIEVESELGSGTSFRIYLPAFSCELDDSKSIAEAPALTCGEETVLLVEDEEGVRELVYLALGQQGYHVLEAGLGEEAIAIAEQFAAPIDLLVTDVVMPRMSGRELADALVQSRPGLKVLFVSGYTDDSALRHGLQESEVNFLQKPFSPASLARKVREILDASPARNSMQLAGV